uniref:Uncharacterized protein n=1 Tax=Panagrolaimus davidi TaxID=227884 RepID=A0A914Q7S5_9BILA
MDIFTFVSPRIQEFSLPSNLIYFINRNTKNAKILEKLQKTCKYLFAKNKVVIIKDAWFSDKNWSTNHHLNQTLGKLENFNAKIWIMGNLSVSRWFDPNSNLNKILCSKIYYNEITSFEIQCAILYLSEFEILTSSKALKVIGLHLSVILDKNDKNVSIDEILKRVSNISEFIYQKSKEFAPETIELTNQTLKNMTSILNGNRLNVLCIYRLSPTFDPNLFFDFIKTAAAPKALFEFYIQCVAFKKFMKKAVNQMLSKWDIPVNQKPSIDFYDDF